MPKLQKVEKASKLITQYSLNKELTLPKQDTFIFVINLKNNSMKHLATLILLLFTSSLFAQDFQGQATYKSKTKIDLKLDSTKTNSKMQQQLREMLKKQFEKTYILSFNREASVFKEDEKLEAPQPAGMNMVMIGAGGGSNILYKNTKAKRFTSKEDVFGKMFLVKDSLETLNWKLSGDTKNIGIYTCYKATLEEEVTRTDFDTQEETTETKTVTAWYTPQIPVSNGPRYFQGLPGLILEINDGNEIIVCSKIVLNPKEKTDLIEPTKGKVVNREKMKTIMDKKMKEMNERYKSNGRDHGESIEIRIGG